MNIYVKSFFQRGLVFAGFGPMILGLIYWILSMTLTDFSLSGREVFIGILSTYLLAFVHAGISVVNQIERMPIAKSALLHFGTLYVAYTVCYLLNSWIPFDWKIFLIYTGIFVGVYLVVWITVLLSVRATGKALNQKLKS